MTRYLLSDVSNAEVIAVAVLTGAVSAAMIYYAWRCRSKSKALLAEQRPEVCELTLSRISQLRKRASLFGVLGVLLGVAIIVSFLNEGFKAVSYDPDQLVLEYRFHAPVALRWNEVKGVELTERFRRRGSISWRLQVHTHGTTYESVPAKHREERKLFEDVGKKLHAIYKRSRVEVPHVP